MVEDLFSCLIDSIQYGILAIDSDGNLLAMNEKARGLLQCKDGEGISPLLQKRFEAILPATGTETPRLEIMSLADEMKVLVGAFLMRNTEDRISGTVYMLFDGIEMAKSMSLNMFQKPFCDFEAILENTYDGLYITDGNANTIMVNKAYERITGIRRDEVLGKNTRESVRCGIIDRSVSLEVIEKRAPVTIVQESRGGKKILVTGNPVFDPATGEIILVANNVRDITELVQLKSELHERTLEANRYLEELDKLKALQEHRSKFVTVSKRMLEILDTAVKVAHFDSNVLITGESGVGKGLLARLIHEASPRKDEPFVKINCAGIPQDLFESELFGYEPGAFSGASTKGKKGLLEVADRGTVFLDEIGDMSLRLQAKILTVIEEKEMTRLGSTKPIKLRVRIMAATNQDLGARIEKKRFRQDLFFRLNTISLGIPPLRDHPEDIIPLVQHFITRLNDRYHSNKFFDASALQALSTYSYPGNVRELSNFTEQAFLVSKGDIIKTEDLPFGVQDCTAPLDLKVGRGEARLDETLRNMEYKILQAAMEKHGSTYKAARSLNMNQSTFVRKMKRLGV
jgi:PAS domain S-box-containing protein